MSIIFEQLKEERNVTIFEIERENSFSRKNIIIFEMRRLYRTKEKFFDVSSYENTLVFLLLFSQIAKKR